VTPALIADWHSGGAIQPHHRSRSVFSMRPICSLTQHIRPIDRLRQSAL
jgi:hypothetical protein